MKRMNDLKKRFLITAGCFALASVSLLLLPISMLGDGDGQSPVGVVMGVLFWAGILSGCVSYLLMYLKHRKFIRKEFPNRKVPAFLRFFSNPAAIVVDVVLILSLAGVIYCGNQIVANRLLDFVSLFLFVTSLYLHFLVTGRIFQYIAYKKKKGVEGR